MADAVPVGGCGGGGSGRVSTDARTPHNPMGPDPPSLHPHRAVKSTAVLGGATVFTIRARGKQLHNGKLVGRSRAFPVEGVGGSERPGEGTPG